MNHVITPYLLHAAEVILQKLTDFRLVKKFPTFYGTWNFITAFTSPRHLSLSMCQVDPVHLPHILIPEDPS